MYEKTAAPRWIGIAVVVLAIVSLAALGWAGQLRTDATTCSRASRRANNSRQYKQNDDVLGQRLAKAEDTNAQLQGELSVVTDKMKLTETELAARARNQEDQGR